MQLLKCRHFFLGLVMTSCLASVSYGQSLELLSGNIKSPSVPTYSTGSEALTENSAGARTVSHIWSTSDYVYVYGGTLQDDSAPNDLWRFHKVNKTWELISGGETDRLAPVYGEKGVSHRDNNPGGRVSAATWIGDDGNLYLFGGKRPLSAEEWSHSIPIPYYCDMWKFDTSTLEWTWIHGSTGLSEGPNYEIVGEFNSASNPPGGEYFATWNHDGKFYLYGGSQNNGYQYSIYADLWCFDPTINQWMIVQAQSGNKINPIYGEKGIADSLNTPGSRTQSACTMDKEGNLWLFSGFMANTAPYNNDLWKLNMETMEWAYMGGHYNMGRENLGLQGAPGEYGDDFLPPGVLLASMYCSEDGKLVLFGGYNAQNYAQLWTYDTKTNQWAYQYGELAALPPGSTPPTGRLFKTDSANWLAKPSPRIPTARLISSEDTASTPSQTDSGK